jgi:hypothetical protein
MIDDHAKPDWIERNTAALLARAQRSPYFADVIADAQDIHDRDALAWDVALAIAVRYWCNALPY